MSDTFDDRLRAIADAHAAKTESRKQSTFQWQQVSTGIIAPTLKAAKEHLRGTLMTGRTEKGAIYLRLVARGALQELSYELRPLDEEVRVTTQTHAGGKDSERISLDSISIELVQSQVEEFLKLALLEN